ncbi:MAG: UDP-N-acetylglucosamine--N-acetylmuramyl-(pentapeptide) pyrophosphoryl-undecaprenol N-acetylglucosamine transferase [Clostridiales bacterium]|nr:UDP-N-acetylglucosamine--N-acetylmuramyl-(pentapeptide) pyrophosphoryl-undecaprenol N-acetylglucosamine transferase [Clostridiales bacterium]
MKKIVFVGGGTAGHVMPNLALIDRLKNEFECVYMGGDGMEKDLCSARGIPFFQTETVKFRRDKIFKNLSVPFKLNKCVKKAKAILKDISPDLIFSKGGYASLPAVLAAKPLGIPLLCHESDFSPGIVTKMSRRRAIKILCAFVPCADRFRNGEYVGSPIRAEIYAAQKPSVKEAAFKKFGLDKTKPVLVVVGGSSGAAALNDLAVGAMPEILKKFSCVHVTGKGKKTDFSANGYSQLEFCTDMSALYSVADVIVSRAGANALAETIALGIPTIAVPLEKASRGDQIENAEYFRAKNAVAVLREGVASPDDILRAVTDTYSNRIAYKAACASLAVDGTERIYQIIKDTINTDKTAD